MIYIFIGGLLFPLMFYISDMYGNNFDAHFSKKTLEKLRVKDDSFFRKIFKFKEGKIIKNGAVHGYRYYLYPRVYALFTQIVLILIGIIVLLINGLLYNFMSENAFALFGGISFVVWIIYTLVINILSQGFGI